jgi:hypothetical protein
MEQVLAEVGFPSEWRGWAWPSELTVTWSTDTADYEVTGRMTSDGPRIERVLITGSDVGSDELRTAILSRFRVGFTEAISSPVTGSRVSLHAGGGRYDPAASCNRLEEVAAAYHDAPPRKKTAAVAAKMGVSYGYARKLVMAAREAGLIDRRLSTQPS